MPQPYEFDPIGADGVLKVRWKTGVVITEELARDLLAESRVITNGKRIPHMADIRLLKSMTREARKVFGDAGDSYTALALLASSPVAQMIGNFFIGLNRTRTPTQMF